MHLTGVLLTLVLFSSQEAAITGSGIIRLHLCGFGDGGHVIALIFDEEAGTMTDPSLAMAGSFADVDGDETEISFLGIPWGEYAVIVFRDRDGDGAPDCDPGEDSSEPFGVSGIEPPTLPGEDGTVFEDADAAPPEGSGGITFGNCSFCHSSDETLVEIVMMSEQGAPQGSPGGPGGPGGMPGGGPGGGRPGW